MRSHRRTVARIIIGIAVAGALALVMWLWFSASSGAPEVVVELPRESRRADTDPSFALQTESRVHVEIGEPSARRPESSGATADAPSQDLRVQVVDPAGVPVAGVPLRLQLGPDAKRPPDGIDRRFSRTIDSGRFSRTADSAGFARFPNVRSVLGSSQDAAPGEHWILLPDIAFENLPVVRLDRASLELPAVIAVIPFSGIVDVHVRELDGKDAPDHSRVELALLRDEDLASPVLPRNMRSWYAETRAGQATFLCVELGRTWEVLASRSDSSVRSRARAPGPVRSRGHALIEVVLGADHPVVVFRAVDERRNPFSVVQLEIQHSDALFGNPKELHRRTDDAGRFSVEMENVRGARKFSDLVVRHQAKDGQVFLGRPSVNKPLELGMNDGGDVVLAPEPILAEGLVQDSSGGAVADAEICVRTDERRMFRGNGDYVDVRGTSDAVGHFELHGLVANGTFDVWARKGALRSTEVRAREGQRGIVLQLSAFYTLSGRWLVGPGVNSNRIGPRFVDAQHKAMRTEAPTRSPDGSFTLAPIPPGVYDIAWTYDGAWLAVLDKVEVTKDTNLGDIDLREKLHRNQIVLVGAPPAVKLQGEVAWRASGSQDVWKNRGFEGTSFDVFTPASPIDLWVRPVGFRCDPQLGVAGQREIPLYAPLHIRIELRTTGQLPKFPYLLYAELEQGGVRVGQRVTAQSFTDDNHTLSYNLSAPGKVRVTWKLEWHPDSGSRSGGVLHEQQVEINVADIPGEQVFTIGLDGTALSQLTAKPPW